MKKLSWFVGAIAAALTCLAVLMLVMAPPHDSPVLSASATLSLVTAAVIGALAVLFLVDALALTALVLLYRGRSALGWVRPSECAGLGSWLAYEWRFFSTGGLQEGRRILGLELAVNGRLS